MADVRLLWGHEVLTPDGKSIRLPLKAIITLRRLGALDRFQGKPQLKPFIYELLDPDYDSLTDGLRRLLGEDATGPTWLICRCKSCRYQREKLADEEAKMVGFMLDMHVQRNAN